MLATIRRRFTLAIMSLLFLAMFFPLSMLQNTAFAQGSTASINPSQGAPGTQVTGTGNNWESGDSILVQWDDGTNLATTTVQSDGTFTVPFTVPSNASQGSHYVYFIDQGYFIPVAFTAGNVDLQTLSIVALQPPTIGASPTFRANIRNNGTVASGFFGIQWIADGTSYYGGHYSIPAGAVDTHDFIWHNLTSGQHTLTFIANYDHGVPETNYNNNQVTITFTPQAPSYNPGNYAGKSGFVSITGYNEPDQYQYRNYCGPGASRVLISAWTRNVPTLKTLATQEQTSANSGTYIINMVTPINNAIVQKYYSIQYATSQAAFSNMIGKDILDNHHPLITGILTISGNNRLNGWSLSAKHIITIYGFDFTSPTAGKIYYYETAGKVSGTKATGYNSIDYNTFWALVNNKSVDAQVA